MCIVKFHILYWLLEKDSHFHTPYLCIHVPLTFTACCGAHDHYFIRLLVFATTRVWSGVCLSKGRDYIHYATFTDDFMDFLVYLTCEYLNIKRQLPILPSPPLTYMMYIDAWKFPSLCPAHAAVSCRNHYYGSIHHNSSIPKHKTCFRKRNKNSR